MHKPISTLGVIALGLGLSAPALADPEADMAKAGCPACHTKDKKLVGPSYKDIAAKNKGKADAVATLTAKARAGGKGVYGQIPMPPNPVSKIGDAELKAAVEWILKQ
jgi:cytochrome c